MSGARRAVCIYQLAYDACAEVDAGNTYPITVSFDADEGPNSNYEITTTSGVLTITHNDLSVWARGWGGTYDGQPHCIDVTVAGDGAL